MSESGAFWRVRASSRILVFLAVLVLAIISSSVQGEEYAVYLSDSENNPLDEITACGIAEQGGFICKGAVSVALPGYFLFETNDKKLGKRSDAQVGSELVGLSSVGWFEKQVPLRRTHRVVPPSMARLGARDKMEFNDPLWTESWHIQNTIKPSSDLNVLPVWNRGTTGAGVTISIVDDGVDSTHPDLIQNWCKECSRNLIDGGNDPRPTDVGESHGTKCAGLIASKPNNSVCGVGVAHGAKISGVRALSTTGTTDSTEATALTYQLDLIDIYSNSWGPDDNSGSVDGPRTLSKAALERGALSGRKGNGAIYVFASGNGGNFRDNCNFDGYANSRFTVAIGALSAFEESPSFAEVCAAQLAVTYAGTTERGLMSTDMQGKCTTNATWFLGTSSAAPLATGVIALMLSKRPDLSWRDVQDIIVHNAVRVEGNFLDDGTYRKWAKNGAGLWFSHKYGFGKLDADVLVKAAATHSLIPHPALSASATRYEDVAINANQPFNFYYTLKEADLKGLSTIEHIEVRVWLTTSHRGRISIDLISPSGTKSHLATPRDNDLDFDKEGFNGWTFMTVASWGEQPAGTWNLRIIDNGHEDNLPSVLKKWEMKFYGVCSTADTIQSNGKPMCRQTNNQSIQQRSLVYASIATLLILSLVVILILFYKRSQKESEPMLRTIRRPVQKLFRLLLKRGEEGVSLVSSERMSEGFDIRDDIESPRDVETPRSGGSPTWNIPPSPTKFSKVFRSVTNKRMLEAISTSASKVGSALRIYSYKSLLPNETELEELPGSPSKLLAPTFGKRPVESKSAPWSPPSRVLLSVTKPSRLTTETKIRRSQSTTDLLSSPN